VTDLQDTRQSTLSTTKTEEILTLTTEKWDSPTLKATTLTTSLQRARHPVPRLQERVK
jgi:hypothetical protein